MKISINSFVFLVVFLINVLSAALVEDDYFDDFEVFDFG